MLVPMIKVVGSFVKKHSILIIRMPHVPSKGRGAKGRLCQVGKIFRFYKKWRCELKTKIQYVILLDPSSSQRKRVGLGAFTRG